MTTKIENNLVECLEWPLAEPFCAIFQRFIVIATAKTARGVAARVGVGSLTTSVFCAGLKFWQIKKALKIK